MCCSAKFSKIFGFVFLAFSSVTSSAWGATGSSSGTSTPPSDWVCGYKSLDNAQCLAAQYTSRSYYESNCGRNELFCVQSKITQEVLLSRQPEQIVYFPPQKLQVGSVIHFSYTWDDSNTGRDDRWITSSVGDKYRPPRNVYYQHASSFDVKINKLQTVSIPAEYGSNRAAANGSVAVGAVVGEELTSNVTISYVNGEFAGHIERGRSAFENATYPNGTERTGGTYSPPPSNITSLLPRSRNGALQVDYFDLVPAGRGDGSVKVRLHDSFEERITPCGANGSGSSPAVAFAKAAQAAAPAVQAGNTIRNLGHIFVLEKGLYEELGNEDAVRAVFAARIGQLREVEENSGVNARSVILAWMKSTYVEGNNAHVQTLFDLAGYNVSPPSQASELENVFFYNPNESAIGPSKIAGVDALRQKYNYPLVTFFSKSITGRGPYSSLGGVAGLFDLSRPELSRNLFWGSVVPLLNGHWGLFPHEIGHNLGGTHDDSAEFAAKNGTKTDYFATAIFPTVEGYQGRVAYSDEDNPHIIPFYSYYDRSSHVQAAKPFFSIAPVGGPTADNVATMNQVVNLISTGISLPPVATPPPPNEGLDQPSNVYVGPSSTFKTIASVLKSVKGRLKRDLQIRIEKNFDAGAVNLSQFDFNGHWLSLGSVGNPEHFDPTVMLDPKLLGIIGPITLSDVAGRGGLAIETARIHSSSAANGQKNCVLVDIDTPLDLTVTLTYNIFEQCAASGVRVSHFNVNKQNKLMLFGNRFMQVSGSAVNVSAGFPILTYPPGGGKPSGLSGKQLLVLHNYFSEQRAGSAMQISGGGSNIIVSDNQIRYAPAAAGVPAVLRSGGGGLFFHNRSEGEFRFEDTIDNWVEFRNNTVVPRDGGFALEFYGSNGVDYAWGKKEKPVKLAPQYAYVGANILGGKGIRINARNSGWLSFGHIAVLDGNVFDKNGTATAGGPLTELHELRKESYPSSLDWVNTAHWLLPQGASPIFKYGNNSIVDLTQYLYVDLTLDAVKLSQDYNLHPTGDVSLLMNEYKERPAFGMNLKINPKEEKAALAICGDKGYTWTSSKLGSVPMFTGVAGADIIQQLDWDLISRGTYQAPAPWQDF